MKLTDGGGHDGGIWFSEKEREASMTTTPKQDAASRPVVTEAESHAQFLTSWADDIDKNAGGHSVDAARLRKIAAMLSPVADEMAGGEDGVERVRKALSEQMEDDNTQNLPSSMCRERGLVWLEGWFDLRAAITALAKPYRSGGGDG